MNLFWMVVIAFSLYGAGLGFKLGMSLLIERLDTEYTLAGFAVFGAVVAMALFWGVIAAALYGLGVLLWSYFT